MSARSSENIPNPQSPGGHEAPGSIRRNRRGRQKRRSLRIILGSLASLIGLAAVAAVGAYAYVNHLAGSIHRVHVARLAAAAGGPSGQAMNVLVTGQDRPNGGPDVPSGLIMILHLNAGEQAGGAVSIHPFALVNVPGHGQARIQDALTYGGPSLLVQTVASVTHVRIDHYARVDLPHVANTVNAVGGVSMPTSSGVMHLNGAAALRYARDPALSEENRVLRQQALLRAIMRKITNFHLLANPATMVRVLNAMTAMLTVDSNFTTSQLATLAKALGGLPSSNATFVIVPYTHTATGQVRLLPLASSLWTAISHDVLAGWAKSNPAWVTPSVVP